MRLLIITQAVDREDPILGFFHRWIEEFAKHCEQVTVVCLGEGAHDLPENVSVHSLGKEEGKGRFTYLLRFFLYTWRYRRNYDAVFVHMNPEYVVLGGLLWRLLGKRIGLWYAHGATSRMLRGAECLVHTVFTSTPEGFRVPSRKMLVVGQGIDTELFTCRLHERQPDQIRIVVVGRLSPVKQCEVAIEAVALLASRGEDVQLTFVGGVAGADGESYRASLETLVRERGLSSRVMFAGPVAPADVVAHLCSADVCAMPSATGSLDKVGLEALAAGVPLVTSNEAFAEVLGEYRNRLMFPSGDAGALAERIAALYTTPFHPMVQVLTDRIRELHGIAQLMPRILAAYDTSPVSHTVSFYEDAVDAKFGGDYETGRWHRDARAEALYEMTRESIRALLLDGSGRYASALELGPGAGTWTRLLIANAPQAAYDLVDISPNMLEKAKATVAAEGVAVRSFVSDFNTFVPDRTYDLFFSIRAFEYLADQEAAVRLVAQLLTPGGVGFIITKTPHYLRAMLTRRRYGSMHRGQIAPKTLARLCRAAGLADIELYPVTFTFPLVRSTQLYRLLYRTFGAWPLNIVSQFFSESYAIRFRKPNIPS